MHKIAVFFCLTLLALPFGHKALAQDAPKAVDASKPIPAPAHYYHLEFVIQELGADGKAVNSRAYSTVTSTDKMDNNGSIRTGSRVPIISGAHPDSSGNEKLGYQYQYVDVGVNFDVRSTAKEVGGQLSFNLVAEVSSLADSHNAGGSADPDPVIRQNRWQAAVLIPIGKPTVVFTSDDLDSKGSLQVVVTAKQLE